MAEGHEFLEYLYLSCKGPAASERALAAGKAGEDIPFQQHSSHNLLRQAGKAGKAPSKLPASYQQVTGKLKYEAKSPPQMRQLKIDHFGVKPQQVTSKLPAS